jgi:hypothetical protein
LTSHRQIRSNRANARASTGPKTAQGKAHSAKNAHRHGLSLPVLAHPALSEEVEALACEIAGAGASPDICELARRIAEAQIDLGRVRLARHDLLSRALGDPDYESPAAKRKKAQLAIAVDKLRARLELIPHRQPTPFAAQLNLSPAALQNMVRRFLTELETSAQSHPEWPQKFATILSDMTPAACGHGPL